MEKDGYFQPLKEEVNFMNAAFLNGDVLHGTNPHPIWNKTLPEVSLQAPPSRTGGLVHAKSDENIGAGPVIFMDNSSGLWSMPGVSMLQDYPVYTTNDDRHFYESPMAPPWRDAHLNLYTAVPQPTLCPTDVIPQRFTSADVAWDGTFSTRVWDAGPPCHTDIQPTEHAALQPNPISPESATTASPPTQSSPGPAQPLSPRFPTHWNSAAVERARRDDFLIKCRASGMKYRDVKKLGNLPEAESTLRGRYRSLTRSREDWGRRSKWTAHDEDLLAKAVHRSVKVRKNGTVRISWTDVVRDIREAGSSSPFGVMACRKKWEQLTRGV